MTPVGSNVLITGGSRGIGRAVALRLADTGARRVLINYLENDAEAEKTQKLVEERDAECRLLRANLAQPAEITKLFEAVSSSVDELHVFVHCAALGAFKPLSKIRPNQWDLTMNINARAFVQCAQACVPLMKDGAIIALSSLGSHRVMSNYGAMGPTKAALEGAIKYLAVELAPSGIRVNGVSAGLVATESLNKFPHRDTLLEEARRRTPAGRIATPDDIAGVVVFLAGPDAGWVHGQIIVADGGLSLL